VSAFLEDTAIFAGLLVGLLAALEVGYRSGLRAEPETEGIANRQVGPIEGALLGLLGLLLAFSFAASGTRFLERQDLIVREANAIGTVYLRADLLAEPFRSSLRSALKDYTAHRLSATSGTRGTADPSIVAEVDAFHARIWKAARDGVEDRPGALVVVIPAVNDLIDLHALRVAAAMKHIPYIVLGLLFASSGLAIAVIGYGCGAERNRRGFMTVPLALIIAAALWVTYDLDHPRRGLLQLDDAPLQALKFDAP
jgi:hypothetical protein